MKICVLYYDGFCEFEVVFAFNQFRGDVNSVALENRVYISEEGQKYLPDKTIDELKAEEIDLFIIPGGDPSHLYESSSLKRLIIELNSKKKYIAGICGGVELMASYGLLENKKCNGDSSGIVINEENKEIFKNVTLTKEDIVIDGNCITSIGKAYVEFAIELGKLMKIYKNEQEAVYDYKWLKNM